MKKIISIVLTCMLCFMITIPVFAEYDGSRYEHVDDTWYVTDYHGSPCSVILYTYIENRQAFPGTGQSFTFDCSEAEFSTGATMATMEYFYYSDKPIEEFEDGKIFYGDFGIEPGTYAFCGGTGNTVLCFDPSISAIDLPTPDEYHVYSEANTVTVKEGDTLVIFALRGDYEWRKAHYQEFYEWSLEKRDQHENYFTSTVGTETMTEESEEEELYYEDNEDGTHSYYTYNEKDELMLVNQECTYNDDICIYCGSTRIIEEVEASTEVPTEMEDAEIKEESKTSKIKDYLGLIIGFVALVALFVLAKIKKR